MCRYMREEKLEIQVWLTSKNGQNTLPNKRDKLVGSAFISLSPLLAGRERHSELRYGLIIFKGNGIVTNERTL